MSTRPYFSLSFVLLCAVLAGACGASSGPPPKVAHASSLEARLGLFVDAPPSATAQQLQSRIEAQLLHAGFRIVPTKDEADVVVQLEIEVRAESGFFKVYKNGQLQTTNVATVGLTLVGDGATLESTSVKYNEGDGISDDQVTRLVATVTNSKTLPLFARKLEERRASAAEDARRKAAEAAQAKHAAEEEKTREENAKENAAWNQIVLSDCREPTTIDACGPLEEFLRAFPTGRHAAQARLVLDAGHQKIHGLEEARDWNNVDIEACRKPKKSTDCDTLQPYLRAHPTGPHADEAKAVLDKSRDTVERLKKKEDRQAAAAKKAEEAKEQHDNCKDQCGSACIDMRNPDRVRVLCFKRCMPRCMKGLF